MLRERLCYELQKEYYLQWADIFGRIQQAVERRACPHVVDRMIGWLQQLQDSWAIFNIPPPYQTGYLTKKDARFVKRALKLYAEALS